MKSVFDPSFKYRPSFETDVRKTFEKIRREQQSDRRKEAVAANVDIAVKVVKLGQSKRSS
jgi:hypothetical protein